MSILCVKTRTCLLFATCVVGTICVTVLWIIGEDDTLGGKGSWDYLVSRTNQRLRNLQGTSAQHEPAEADSYLRMLGFDPEEHSAVGNKGRKAVSPEWRSQVTTDGKDDDSSVKQTDLSAVMPVIAVPVQSSQASEAWDLYNSVLLHAPEMTVFFYDIGLGYYEKLDLVNRCKNVTFGRVAKRGNCQLRYFDWSLFPGHILQHKLETYRPLIIHDALNDSGAVLYLSPTQRFRDRVPPNVLEKARRLGVIGWRLNDDSTSALTHPKTFAFFHTDAQNYYFHRAIGTDRLLVYNTRFIRNRMIFPWLQCSLTFRCVSPLGAQDTGCRLYRKPLYLYSGCHRYDLSVMNVVLGMMFNFDSASYTVDVEEGKFVTSQTDLLT